MKPSKNASFLTIACWLITCLAAPLGAQDINIHSHNDYLQQIPFWEAYASGTASIEADVILRNDTLFVAHEKESIRTGHTLSSLYLEPMVQAKRLQLGSLHPFILLVDFKTEAYATMHQLLKELEPYQELWEDREHPFVKIVISGNRPEKKDYHRYPFPVFFDYQSVEDTESLPLDKIELFSLSFRSFSQWNGKGRLIDSDIVQLKEAIRVAHQFGKPIRFWATPDSKTAWKALHELGVDYINTDHPGAAKSYLSSLQNRLYTHPTPREIYRPTFESDGTDRRVKNVILLIGDGNGLAQLSAAMYANNNQLTLTQLKNLGLIKTQSADDFTTDSAAAGTALASGQKAKNRSIGMHPDGTPAANLPEYLAPYGFNSGIITTDHLTGATPAAFFAHQPERDLTRNIASDLAKSPLSLFIGGGKIDFLDGETIELENLEKSGFILASSLRDLVTQKGAKAGYFASNQGLPKISGGRRDFLPEATKAGIDFLNSKDQPFFLMIESAYIDSGGHANEVGTVINEGIDFDQAVAEAVRFADGDGHTLVLITADHETGGVTIPQGNTADNTVELEFSTEDHTGLMVPVFAYGPHSHKFRGVYENTEIFSKLIKVLELESSR
ncbi:alkaline phosphatase [Cyclobacterium jeungdonense]|uniref:Alkaline phosphatase n=1 Tax=Cyclobacterium jeungdonense TaxID=708087 RepID=A0ABT8C0R7_9BACT|nr:alkaline phosphatase [Cyclobacterium jeungdonense]MDN3686379.1 alkaline phosphatase [Cyclobacterium jeungdonense]